MNRREFLQCAAIIAASASVVPKTWAMSDEQQVFLATEKDYINRQQTTLFTKTERSAVAAIAEQIIPQTDTPGAGEAGVPRFIELMVQDWFNDDERVDFMAGLHDLQDRGNGDFAKLSVAAQLAILEQLEDEADKASWYQLGNIMRVWDSTAPFICQFKELTVLGFFFSEVGSTQVLRQNSMGVFKGDIPLLATDVSYAAEMPARTELK